MKRFVIILVSLAVVATNSAFAQSRAAAGLDKLKSLAGEWMAEGPEGLVNVSYQITSGGTALIETRTPANEPSMVTIFHLDGDNLMMEHYCSAGNQPRMRAELRAGDLKKITFTFIDVTNLAKPSAGYMRGLMFSFVDEEHFTQVWTWREGGKDTSSTFNMKRKARR